MPAQPAVTVLMPAYNCAQFVDEAIQSILAQSFTDFELLIVDDGSDDETGEVIRSFKDPRIRLLENRENLGVIKALNIGLEQAQGTYIARMDADDLSLPQRLAKQVAFMERTPQAAVCGAGMTTFSQQGPSSTWLIVDDPERLKADLVFHMVIPHGSIIFRREQQRREGIFYSEDFPHAEDYHFLYQLSRVGEIRAVEEVLYRYRVHEAQTSTIHNDAQRQTADKVRALILAEAGVSYSAKEWEIHTKLEASDYPGLADNVVEMASWLGKLHRALSQGGDYNPGKLSEVMWNFWMLLCLSQPRWRAVACLARIFRPPLSRVFPWHGKLALKMLLYYIYRQAGDALSARN
ncbi:MAG: glycosyltransferase [Deltaproteobacteria bacterium]|nr:glycosyltransferase [Deltaproteobacteria bacterium]